MFIHSKITIISYSFFLYCQTKFYNQLDKRAKISCCILSYYLGVFNILLTLAYLKTMCIKRVYKKNLLFLKRLLN